MRSCKKGLWAFSPSRYVNILLKVIEKGTILCNKKLQNQNLSLCFSESNPEVTENNVYFFEGQQVRKEERKELSELRQLRGVIFLF